MSVTGGHVGAFQAPRFFARRFLGALSNNPQLQGEILAAIDEALKRYDTGPFENRFAVGGIIEQILGSAARALGLQINNAGARLQKYDLELSPGQGLSVKAKFGLYSRSTKVRLTNSQGATGVWDTGTLFVLTGVGIGYADVGLAPGATVLSGDQHSLDIAVLPLLHLWGFQPRMQKGQPPPWLSGMTMPTHAPGYFLQMPIPDRPAVPAPRLVSDPLALDILQSGHSPQLLTNFKWSV